MTKHEFAALRPGDLIRKVDAKEGYTVRATYSDGTIVADRTVHIKSPEEWVLVFGIERHAPADTGGL